jgi:integrase
MFRSEAIRLAPGPEQSHEHHVPSDFPGCDPLDPMTTRQLNRVVHEAAELARIDKRVWMHALRYCFATHLIEQPECCLPIAAHASRSRRASSVEVYGRSLIYRVAPPSCRA